MNHAPAQDVDTSACLSCSPCHFFRYGIAHVFLLGLLKDFWNVWLHQVTKAEKRQGFVLPGYIRRAITERGPHIQTTELFGKPYTDLIRYRSPVHVYMSMQYVCMVWSGCIMSRKR